ncbi:unnamed protein product [Amoebophrya sp. A25]|nr:unnamed protein product [Amoebophrya sp. A25]|eukprot:GSA25T00022867001.1
MTDLLLMVEDGMSDWEICQSDYVTNLADADKNAVIKSSGARQLTPLSFAASANYNRLVTALLEVGCDPNVGNPSALHYAASVGNIAIVRLLIKHGADVNIMDAYNQTPLFFARNADTVHYLVEHGAKMNLKNTADQTVLHTLAFNGCVDSLSYLLRLLPKDTLDTADKAGRTCLHHAEYHYVQMGEPSCVALLLSKGTNHLAKTNKGIMLQPNTLAAAITHAKLVQGAVSGDINIEDIEQNMAENAVAAKLQAAARGRMARKKVDAKKQEMRAEEEAAATKVQNLYRAREARRNVGAKRRAKKDEETEKELKAMLGESVTLKEVEKAAGKVQASFRGKKARERVEDLKAENRYTKATQSFASNYCPPAEKPETIALTVTRESSEDPLGIVYLNGEKHFQHQFPSIPKDYAPKVLLVTKVGLGAVLNHNRDLQSTDAKSMLRMYDRILSVNGKRTPTEMIEEFRSSALKFDIQAERYPNSIRVKLDRSGEGGLTQLGLSFDRKYSKTHLRVLHVKGGKGGEAEAAAGGDGDQQEMQRENTREQFERAGYVPSTVVMAWNLKCAQEGKYWQCIHRSMLISEVNGYEEDASSLADVMRDTQMHQRLNLTLHRGTAQARRDLQELLFSPAKELHLRRSKMRKALEEADAEKEREARKRQRDMMLNPKIQKAKDSLYTQNMSLMVAQNPRTEQETLSALAIVSPKQKRMRALELENAIPIDGFMKIEKFWDKSIVLSIALTKPTPDRKYGISFFDGAEAFEEANKALPVNAPQHLVVKAVVWGGLLHDYNEMNMDDADKKVSVGDRILSVNGVRDDLEGMKEQLRASDSITIEVQKFARYFSFFTKKVNGDIGLGLQLEATTIGNKNEIKIGKVYGSTQVVNKRLVELLGRYDLVLEPFMRLCGVNGRTECDTNVLRQEIVDAKEGSWIKLHIRRAQVLKLAVMKVRKQVMAMMFMQKLGGGAAAMLPAFSDEEEEDDDGEEEEDDEEDDPGEEDEEEDD